MAVTPNRKTGCPFGGCSNTFSSKTVRLGPARGHKVCIFQLATADYIRSGKSLCREAGGAHFDKTDLEALFAARIEAGIVSHTFICDDVSSTPIGRHELRFTRKSLPDGVVTLPRPITIRVPDKGW